jgi:hypothetical protein
VALVMAEAGLVNHSEGVRNRPGMPYSGGTTKDGPDGCANTHCPALDPPAASNRKEGPR